MPDFVGEADVGVAVGFHGLADHEGGAVAELLHEDGMLAV